MVLFVFVRFSIALHASLSICTFLYNFCMVLSSFVRFSTAFACFSKHLYTSLQFVWFCPVLCDSLQLFCPWFMRFSTAFACFCKHLYTSLQFLYFLSVLCDSLQLLHASLTICTLLYNLYGSFHFVRLSIALHASLTICVHFSTVLHGSLQFCAILYSFACFSKHLYTSLQFLSDTFLSLACFYTLP